jgi:uncharacterized RDD family membrane protein YckC
MNKRLWQKRFAAATWDFFIPFAVASYYWWNYFVNLPDIVTVPLATVWKSVFLHCTLPWMLSSLLLEISPFRRTLGKFIFKVRVYSHHGIKCIIYRNLLKWVSIEFCIACILIACHYIDVTPYASLGGWYLLAVPAVALAYCTGYLIMTNGYEAWYDTVAETEVLGRKMFFSNTTHKLRP